MSKRVVLERLAIATLVSVFALMMLGGYVKAIGAGLSCPHWPKCFDGQGLLHDWFPFVGADTTPWTMEQVAAEWIHRFVAAAFAPLMLATTWLAWRLRPVDKAVRLFATLPLVLLPIQIVFGGLTVLHFLEPIIVTSHLGFATLIFGSIVALNVLLFTRTDERGARGGTRGDAGTTEGSSTSPTDPREPPRAPADPALMRAGEEEPSGAAPGPMTSRPWTGRLQQALGPWVELVKPGILFLLVLCGLAAMFLAGSPSWQLVAATLFGGALAASSAAAFNNYLDRDRDALLARTKKRSIPSARIPPSAALVFAFATGLAAFGYLWWRANLLTALLAIAGIAFYVYYTIWLKPSTVQNIVIGGAAGAAPALVGWAAVTGQLALPALLLGFIIFAWTPPHFWALALVYRADYAKGAVPMYPVVKGEERTRWAIFGYTVLTVVATLLFFPMDVLGWIYLVAAAILGAWFLAMAARLLVKKDNKAAYGLFAYSIVYLALLFGAMVVDRLVL